MKKIVSLLMVLILALSLVAVPTFAEEPVGADWPSFRGNDANNGVTHAETPRSAEEAMLKWAVNHSTSWSDAPSPMIIAEDSLIVMYGQSLKKLSLKTGEVLASADMAQATSWGSTPALYADGKIFCQLGSSTLQAFDAKTLECLWTYTDEISGQAQCPVVYSEGKIYVGFGYNAESPFVCLNAETGELVWRALDPNGYYWAGAVVVGGYVIYGTESGTLYSRNKQTGEVVTELKCSETAKIRSTVTYDNGKLYWMLNDATVCRADINAETGAVTNLTTKTIGEGLQSTSTITVYGGILYTAASDKNVVALNADTLETLWTVEQPGYPQCSILLSDAYIDSGYVYLYVTYNKTPGGLNVIKAKADGSEAEGATLFDAADYQNYCICSVVADSNGTLYYKNDTGNVFAIGTSESAQNQQAAEAVIAQIDAIGEVTLASADSIETARSAYDALTEEQKALVSNYETLTAAEAKLEQLKDEATATPVTVYVTIASKGSVVMAQEKVTVTDMNNNGFFDVDDALYAAHEAGFEGGAAAGYASAYTQWGLGISMLWGDTSYAYGYWLNNASCWSLEDAVTEGDHLVAFVYTDGTTWSDAYSKFDKNDYTVDEDSALTIKLEKAGYDENWNTVFTAHAGAVITVYDSEMKAVDADVTDNGDGTYTVIIATPGTYYLAATGSDPIIVPAVCQITVAEKAAPVAPAHVYVTISKAGSAVMLQEKVTVTDRNGNGFLDVDDALFAAHEACFEGGAAAGYASAYTQWGLGISMLWGDTSYAYGYWLNNASCWSLEDAVTEGDHLVAFVYTDSEFWSDSYSKFDAFDYTATTAQDVVVKLQKAGYDENWNTVFTAHAGATITVYDSEGKALTEGYAVTDNGDGSYTIRITAAGSYYVVATDNDPITVPAACQVVVTHSEQVPVTGDSGMVLLIVTAMSISGLAVLCIGKKYAF